jgi:hypothetical protein
MMVRPWLVAASCLGTLSAWAPSTPTGTQRYRLELKTSVVQDLTALGQGEQKQDFANTGFVSVTAQDSAGGQSVTLLLDSLVPGESSPIPADQAKSAAGMKWHGYRQPSGRVTGLKAETDTPIAAAIEPALLDLFPPMKRGTGEGRTWTDTTDADNNGIAIRTVTNFQTSGDSVNGTKVIRLAGAFSSAISGQQASPQGAMSIEGTGTGTTTWVVGADGTCISATHSTNQSISVSVAQLPAPIPVKVKTEGTAILIP